MKFITTLLKKDTGQRIAGVLLHIIVIMCIISFDNNNDFIGELLTTEYDEALS